MGTRTSDYANGDTDLDSLLLAILFRAEGGMGKESNSRANNVVKGVAPRDRETRRKWRIDGISDIGGNLLLEILS